GLAQVPSSHIASWWEQVAAGGGAQPVHASSASAAALPIRSRIVGSLNECARRHSNRRSRGDGPARSRGARSLRAPGTRGVRAGRREAPIFDLKWLLRESNPEPYAP